MFQRVSVLVDNNELVAHPDLPGEFALALDWVRERLARDEPGTHTGAPDPERRELRSVLGQLLFCLPSGVLDELAGAVRAEGCVDLVRHYNHRRQTLGQFDRQIEGVVPVTDLDAFATELDKITEPTQLESLLSGYCYREALTYPWVFTSVRERGLTAAFADYAAGCEPGVFLRALVGVWEEITTAHQTRLAPLIDQAIDLDRRAGQHCRFLVLPLLSVNQLRRQWSAEMSHQRKRQRFELVDAYSTPLGLAHEHASVVAEVASWFLSER
jgi:hypothetical protein